MLAVVVVELVRQGVRSVVVAIPVCVADVKARGTGSVTSRAMAFTATLRAPMAHGFAPIGVTVISARGRSMSGVPRVKWASSISESSAYTTPLIASQMSFW